MRDGRSSTKVLILGSIFALSCPVLAAHANPQVNTAQTSASHARGSAATLRAPTAHVANHAASYHAKSTKGGHGRQVARGGISCVPYARNVSGIEVAGNAWQWWDNAEGRYARGRVPERGSVLAFRSNGRMQLGHVAVVSRVINSREIEVDHANWGGYRGSVAHGVPVVDVSEANNWTAVRVGLGRSSDFGSVYPTYGFIYDRPDDGVMMAHNVAPAPTPELNPIPSDLRPAAERPWHTYEEVAEAPATRTLRNGQVAGQVFAAPDRK
jgi:surface antigen